MGWRWYIGSGFLMMIGTFAIALFVPWFLDLIPDPVSFIGGSGGGGLAPLPQPLLLSTSNDDAPDKGPGPPPPRPVDSSDDGYHSSSLGSFRRWKRETVVAKNDVEKGY